MPFVAAPNIVSVEVRALLDGQKIENRFTVNALAAPDSASVLDIAQIVAAWAIDTYFPLLPNAVMLTEVFAKDLSNANGAQATVVPSTAVVGGQASIPAPNETTFCVSLRSTSAGRSARGRVFTLALPRDLVVGNHINPTLRGQLVAAFQVLDTRLTTGGYDWVIVSYRTNNAPRPGGPVYFSVATAVSVDDIVDSQRRRKPGNGS